MLFKFTLNLEYCCSTTKGSVLCDAKLKALSELVSFFKSSLSAIACFDWPGQGLSDRPLKNPIRGHVTTFNTYVDAMVRGLAVIADRAPKARIVVAHSMGSAISLEALRTGKVEAKLCA